MIKLLSKMKIYVSMKAVDARKSIDGLCALISKTLEDNPQCRNLFISFNKSKDKIKILWWDANGFVLHYKHLEKRRFFFQN